MPPDGYVRAARSDLMSIRKKARRGIDRARVAPVAEMTPEDRLQHVALAAVTSSIANVSSDRSFKDQYQAAIQESKQVSLPAGIGGSK